MFAAFKNCVGISYEERARCFISQREWRLLYGKWINGLYRLLSPQARLLL